MLAWFESMLHCFFSYTGALMMRKVILFLLLLSLPSLGFAKQCPTCLKVFQSQTVRGQTRLLYQWLSKVMSPKNPLKYGNVKRLFNKNITITVNGNRMASGLPATYRYLMRLKRTQPLEDSKLRRILVDGQHAALQFQTITRQKGQRYRTLVITILEFKEHKLLYWHSVNHALRTIS